jgi:exopolyphosphatase/guanosine-5'-triphosphate,3'-diphosphate pyrophosphatase
MRLGVLDIGSNTGHLLVVDAHGGAAPMPAFSYKEPLRLAEHLDDGGAVSKKGIEALTGFVSQALVVAEDKGCEEILGFATSAVRDAVNSTAVLEHVKNVTGVEIGVLSGEDEARLTFLAVRRWFGWSSGRLAVFDIGGGSLEIAAGSDEAPDVAQSLPLGAGRVTREWLRDDQPSAETVSRCLASPRFLGFCFDECEHWITNGIGVTAGKPFAPHFYDAEGDTLPQAYEGNLHNLQILMARCFPGFAERAR